MLGVEGRRYPTLVLAALAALAASLMCWLALDAQRAEADHSQFQLGWPVECKFRKTAKIDPILYPGEVGTAHSHDFIGGNATATTTFASLREGDSTCTQPDNMPAADHSAYWVPTAYRNGVRIGMRSISAYYRPGEVNPNVIEPWPHGFRMIAGDVVSWGCGGGAGDFNQIRSDTPVDCTDPDDPYVKAEVTFPQCISGADSSDHYSHVRRPVVVEGATFRQCPDSHPTTVPRLTLTVRYNTSNGDNIQLSSGDPSTMHADLFDGWRKPDLQTLINRCMDTACNAAGQVR